MINKKVEKLNNIKMYYIGQRFENKSIFGERKYILAEVYPNIVNLIALDTGKRWSKGVKVKDIKKITEQEMRQLANNYDNWENFKFFGVKSKKTVNGENMIIMYKEGD